jgi:hypothetical protein
MEVTFRPHFLAHACRTLPIAAYHAWNIYFCGTVFPGELAANTCNSQQNFLPLVQLD